MLGPPRVGSRLETPSNVATGPLESPIALPPPPQAATGPVSLRNVPVAARGSLARKGEWGRRLLWIPILMVAALAGYLSYLLIAVR